MSADKINEWSEAAQLVMSDLKRFEKSIEKLTEQVNNLRVEISVLKTRISLYAGVVGTIAGLLASSVIQAIFS